MKMDEQFKKELEKTNKFVDKVYDKMNLFPNPDPEINETIAMGLTNNKIKHGLRYCPCFIVQGETKELPLYKTKKIGGSDHEPIFISTVTIPVSNKEFEAKGASKKEAQKNASKLALEEII